MKRTNDTAAFALLELLVVIGCIGVLAALLLLVISAARAQSKKDVCLSNLRQLGHAIQLYTTDYDGRLPYGPGPITKGIVSRGDSLYGDPLDTVIRELPDIRALLSRYGTVPSLFRCPMDRNGVALLESGHPSTWFEEFGSSYEYCDRQALESRSLDMVQPPGDSLVLGDAEFFHGGRNPNDGLVNELFADFHVKSITWAQRTSKLKLDE